MRYPRLSVILLLLCASLCPALKAVPGGLPKLENPISVDYLRMHLRPIQPRLVLTPAVEKQLRFKLKTDPVLQNMVRAVQLNKDMVFKQDLLTRKQIGRRLLSTSREMLWRMNVLGLVYRIEKDSQVLARIDEELKADGKIRIVSSDNNWNQVCNGGMIAAALTIAEVDMELAADVIRRALEALPKALRHYAPDGAYPEGSTYWQYATMYTAMTASMLESALGSDMGIWESPGLTDSAMFRVLMNAPSGEYYNYGDCGTKRSVNGDLTLAWFAAQTGDELYFDRDRFSQEPQAMGRLERHVGMAMVWLSQYQARTKSDIPTAWAGDGINPVIVFYGGPDDPHQYYLGAKGGNASISHGNMRYTEWISRTTGQTIEQELYQLEKQTLMETVNVANQRQEKVDVYSGMLHQYLNQVKKWEGKPHG